MKDTSVFFNPFRLISPKLDSEANRLEEMFETPPDEVTYLEEGLLVMANKLILMVRIVGKTLIVFDAEKADEAERLGREIHDEEKKVTGDAIVRKPDETSGDILKAVVLFPGRLERVGDHIESILNCARIKSRTDILFTDRTNFELGELFDLLIDILTNFRDVLATRNQALLGHILGQGANLSQMILDFQASYEDRLLEGACSPKSASIVLDVLDSVKYSYSHIREMCETLLNLTRTQKKG